MSDTSGTKSPQGNAPRCSRPAIIGALWCCRAPFS